MHTPDTAPHAPHPAPTVLAMTASTRIVIWVFCAGAGVLLGFILPWLLGFIAGWPLPYLDVLKFLASFDAPAMVLGRPVVLGAIGLIIALVITHESPSLTIDAEQILVRTGDDTRSIARELVGGVYRTGGKVRIESPAGRVLFHDDVEGGRQAIAAAFQSHGYPWEGVETPRSGGAGGTGRTVDAERGGSAASGASAASEAPA